MGLPSQKKREAIIGYIYILPCFLLIFVFHFIPVLMIFGLSLTKYNLMQAPQWYGFKNFAKLVIDRSAKGSLMNTISYTAMVVPAQTVLALAIAVVLALYFRGKFGEFVRGSLFVPVVSSTVLVATVWLLLLATDGGTINQFLSLIGISAVNWLGDLRTALPAIAMATIWKNVGYFLVIYYAGIMDIPISLFEAARVDGATAFQQFRYIILPILRPITLLVVTLGTIWSFQVFDMVYVMTGGGPGRSTLTLVLSIYNSAFRNYNIGYASAMAVLMFCVVMLVSVLQKRILSSERGLWGA